MVKEIAALAIRLSGLPLLLRTTIARNKVTIVTYHNPRAEILDRHLAYLGRRYRFISLGCLAHALHDNDWRNIPPRSLVVTFDDGHAGNYQLIEVFKKHIVEPTIYLCTGIVGTHRHYWWTRVDAPRREELKLLPDAERLRILETVYHHDDCREYPGSARQTLSRSELSQLLPYVEFGSHTQTHPILPNCSDEETAKQISASKRWLEETFPARCLHFAYPNGDYGKREKEWVRDAGYLTARTIDVGWNGMGRDPYELRTTGIPDDASINIMVAHLTGIPLFLKYLMKGCLGGRSR